MTVPTICVKRIVIFQGMKQESNDVKQLIGQLVSYITSSVDKPLNPNLTKLLIPSLVMGTKERNTVVKANSEFALISLLQLRQGDSYLKVNNVAYTEIQNHSTRSPFPLSQLIQQTTN